ncbi:MAG TPA: class I SAM-dependent methyltransferase [Chitinophagaceae bacterium]|mgnify:CR=1 FL=1|nr:class I SAM-dependent methyltransferase [Chitinophagaceae bacterium]
MKCRFCQHEIQTEFIDLINSPASNSFLSKEQLNEPETYYPLKVYVCDHCFLVQVDEYKSFDSIFDNNYAYYSSYSTSWLAHCKNYVENVIQRFGLTTQSHVVEIASNDGYLLQYFLPHHIPVLGIEPTKNTAEVAILKGIPCITEFFGVALATELHAKGTQADLIIGNNVLAHVPNILDFVQGIQLLLSPDGVVTMEMPSLIELVENNQFDTIYHEHFSYLSLTSVKTIFEACKLSIFDVENLPTHGGSIRIYAAHTQAGRKIEENVEKFLKIEHQHGINTIDYYKGFQQKAEKVKYDLLHFLLEQKKNGKKVAAYGAAAKGNTLLNFCGVKNDLIDFVVDANPHKQHKFLPASHIPVVKESVLQEAKPDYVLILPWNLKDEIIKQLSYVKDWGGMFVVPIPQLEIL